MRKGLRGFVDDALARTGPLAVEKSGDFPTARPFAHKLHRALFSVRIKSQKVKTNRITGQPTGTGRAPLIDELLLSKQTGHL
jgi:hypothetical protein